MFPEFAVEAITVGSLLPEGAEFKFYLTSHDAKNTFDKILPFKCVLVAVLFVSVDSTDSFA